MKSKIWTIILSISFIILLFGATYFVNKYTLPDNNIKDNISGENIENENKEENEVKVVKVTKENFEEEVVKHEGTILIDFYADWCGPCKMMGPVIEELANENPNVKFCKVNVDEQEELAIHFGAMSLPTFVIIKDGKIANGVVGMVPKEMLEKEIK